MSDWFIVKTSRVSPFAGFPPKNTAQRHSLSILQAWSVLAAPSTRQNTCQKARAHRLLNASGVQALQRQQLDRVAMLNEDVR